MVDSTSSSSLHPESARRINSTPTLQSSGVSKSSSRHGIRVDGKIGDRGSKIRKCPPLDHPSPFADSRHSIIDISNLDYKAYRHRLIEAALRKQYDDFQPPGDVVLNSLHLNSIDSVIGVQLSDRYDHSLFDFVEEYYDVADAKTRKNIERLHPLDHFLPRDRARRPRTSEKETETISHNDVDRENSRNHLSGNVDSNFAKLPGMDDNGNPCVPPDDVFARRDRDSKSEVPILRRSIPTRSRKRADKTTSEQEAEDDCPRSAEQNSANTRRKSSWTRNDPPASVGNSSKFSLPRAATPGNREVMGSLGPGTNADRSCKSKKKLGDYPSTVFPLSDKRRAKRETGERSNFISVSSSEIASIRSDSSKRRDDEVSCRSRESSISPRSRASSRPPWLSGNRGTSFNRKYGRNIAEISAARVARPMSARGSSSPWQKLAVSSQGHSKESSTASMSRNPALFGRKAASFVASRGKEFTGTTEENLAARSKSKDVGSVEDNEEGRTLKTADLPSGEKMKRTTTPTLPDDNAAFSSSARRSVRPRKRSPRAVFDALASKTSATKKPELITSRCGSDDARGRQASGNNAPRLSPTQDRREKLAKLNRGGRRQLRSVENPSKGASLSPQIELSAEVLNPADDTDKFAISDGERLAELTSRIDPRGNAEPAESGGIRAESAANDDVARSGAPKIIRDPRTRPASANNLPESRRLIEASHPARWDANSETKSGLNGTRLNTRSNGAVDEMRYGESPSVKASSLAPAAEAKETRQGDAAGRDADEELRLPRHDSKVGLAMNSALKRYIKMLKRGLLNHGDKDGVALASLSLSDAIAILSEQRTPLSPEEIQELQTVLDRIERNPELLCKLSCRSMESVA